MIGEVWITKKEAGIILGWYETTIEKASRFGSAEYIFPEEQMLVERLKKCYGKMFLDEYEIQTVSGWMDKVLYQMPGQTEFYFPEEETLVQKIREAT